MDNNDLIEARAPPIGFDHKHPHRYVPAAHRFAPYPAAWRTMGSWVSEGRHLLQHWDTPLRKESLRHSERAGASLTAHGSWSSALRGSGVHAQGWRLGGSR